VVAQGKTMHAVWMKRQHDTGSELAQGLMAVVSLSSAGSFLFMMLNMQSVLAPIFVVLGIVDAHLTRAF